MWLGLKDGDSQRIWGRGAWCLPRSLAASGSIGPSPLWPQRRQQDPVILHRPSARGQTTFLFCGPSVAPAQQTLQTSRGSEAGLC